MQKVDTHLSRTVVSLSSTARNIATAASHIKVQEAYTFEQKEFLQYALLISDESALQAIAPARRKGT